MEYDELFELNKNRKNKLFISCEIHRSAGELGGILKKICDKIGEREIDVSIYSNEITDVGIIVNCFPDDFLTKGFGKPRKYISYKNGYADIRLPMPYNEFKGSDPKKKYLMAVKNIIRSIEVIEERCRKSKKASFDGEKMISDILEKLEIRSADLEGINGVSKE